VVVANRIIVPLEPQHLVGQDQMQPIMGKKYQSRNPSENFSPQKSPSGCSTAVSAPVSASWR
jgi:hypothetical protein